MVYLRNICVNTLHKGDSIFTYNNNNNNNNNNNSIAVYVHGEQCHYNSININIKGESKVVPALY
jgi:hypothetical protein